MIPNKQNLKKAGIIIYQLLSNMKKCSYKQLQLLSGLNDTSLCMGILYLLKSNKIIQYPQNDEIFYSLTN
ncbi:MAG: winged helix-turn-helix domain-containing protein [Phocaeicola sp.]|nr:winged helix-turn-helix domain-containing protein [Phocaeicola sp.]